VYNLILSEARRLIGAELGQLLLVHHEPDYMTIHATTGKEANGTFVAVEGSFCGEYVFKTGRSHKTGNLNALEYRDKFVNFLGTKTTPMLSELAVPVFVGNRIIAILNFESPFPDAFTEKISYTNLHPPPRLRCVSPQKLQRVSVCSKSGMRRVVSKRKWQLSHSKPRLSTIRF
jgi:hypothetical protein